MTAVDTRTADVAPVPPVVDATSAPQPITRVAPAAPAPPRAVTEQHTVIGDLRQIVDDFVQSRDLLQQLTLRDVRIRYKQATLGFLWALLMPTVIVLSGMAVRAAIAYAAGRSLDGQQIASMTVKSVPWAFFVGCINVATPSLIANISLVTKIYFPREVLPIAAVLAQTFDSVIGGAIVALLMPLFGVGVSAQLLWVPLLLVLLWTLAAATALFLSCANLFFRDVKYLVQVFLTFGIFVTPVLMDASMYGPKGAKIVMMNPVAPLLEGLRLTIVEHHNLLQPYMAPAGFVIWKPWYLGYSAAIAVFGLLGSAIMFHRSERRFAEII